MRKRTVSKPDSTEEPSSADSPLVRRGSPLVFISHDSRDADLAESFSNLLTDASGGVLRSFRSSDRKGTAGIEFGAEWYNSIMSKLGDATDVVALLTVNSVDRPWLLYEAGVAKGKLEATVFGVAIGIPLDQASRGPFAQFQNSADDEDSLTKLVIQLIKRNPDASPREEAVRLQVKAFRQSIEQMVEARGKIKSVPGKSEPDQASIAKLFEEVKVMFRELPDKVEVKLKRASPGKLTGRIHPSMVEELLFRPMPFEEELAGMPLRILFFVSLFRDDLPWLYEVGLDLYRSLFEGDRDKINRSRRNFLNALEFTQHTRWGRRFMAREEEVYYMFKHFADELLERLEHLGDEPSRESTQKIRLPKQKE